MLRMIIKPDSDSYNIEIPKEYIDTEVEILVLPFTYDKVTIVYTFPSAFSFVPSLIGSCQLIDPVKNLSAEKTIKLIEESLQEKTSQFTPYQRVHSIIYLLKNNFDNISIEKKLYYMQLASKLDPDNIFCQIVYASYLYDDTKTIQADELLKNLFFNRLQEV